MRVHVGTKEKLTRAGGLHNYVQTLARGQRELGFETEIIEGIDSRQVWEPNLLSEDSIMHFHFAQTARLVSSTNPNQRMLFHFHGPWAAEGRRQGDSRLKVWVKQQLERRTYSGFDRFVTASAAFATVLEREYGIDESRISVVYPGVDTSRFRPDSDANGFLERLGVSRAALTLATVRRLEPRMGIAHAIEAVAAIHDAQLLIGGVGSLRHSLESYAAELGVSERVIFLGRVSDADLPSLYRSVDATLVPTIDLEGFGLVVLESFASGTPVIATRVGGLPEAMGPFADRWAVQPGSGIHIADALRDLTDYPPKSELRAYAESRSLPAFAKDVERVVAEYE